MKKIAFNKNVMTLSRVIELIKETEFSNFEFVTFEDKNSALEFAYMVVLTIGGIGRLNELMQIIVKDNDYGDWDSKDFDEVAKVVADFFLSLDLKLQKQIMTIITEKKKLKDLAITEVLNKIEDFKLQLQSVMDSTLDDMQSIINT
jgi:hypothetical protein